MQHIPNGKEDRYATVETLLKLEQHDIRMMAGVAEMITSSFSEEEQWRKVRITQSMMAANDYSGRLGESATEKARRFFDLDRQRRIQFFAQVS